MLTDSLGKYIKNIKKTTIVAKRGARIEDLTRNIENRKTCTIGYGATILLVGTNNVETNSPTEMIEKYAIQEILEGPILSYKEVYEVRWLSFHKALEAIHLTWDSLVTLFVESPDAKAKGFVKTLSDYKFVATSHMLMDTMSVLTALCLKFQCKDLDIAVVQPAVQATIQALEKIKSGGDAPAAAADSVSYLDMLGTNVTTEDGKKIYKGHVLSRGEQAKTHFQSVKENFIGKVVENLNARFPNECQDILSQLAVLSLKPVSFLSRDQLSLWGNSEIASLAKHYDSLVSSEATKLEWNILKEIVNKQGYPRGNMPKLWQVIAMYHRDEFPNLIKLAAIALTLPVHTSDCERGFSVQNRLKTPLRNRLSPERLNKLMTVCIEGPDGLQYADDYFEEAVLFWRSQKKRRIFTL